MELKVAVVIDFNYVQIYSWSMHSLCNSEPYKGPPTSAYKDHAGEVLQDPSALYSFNSVEDWKSGMKKTQATVCD